MTKFHFAKILLQTFSNKSIFAHKLDTWTVQVGPCTVPTGLQGRQGF